MEADTFSPIVFEPESKSVSSAGEQISVLSKPVQPVSRQKKKSNIRQDAWGVYLILPPVAEPEMGLETDSESRCTLVWQSSF